MSFFFRFSSTSLCYHSLKQVTAFAEEKIFNGNGTEREDAAFILFSFKMCGGTQCRTVYGVTWDILSLSPLGESLQTKPNGGDADVFEKLFGNKKTMAVVFLCADLSGVHTFPATRFLIALEYCKCSYFLLPDHQKLSKVHFLFFSSSSLGR